MYNNKFTETRRIDKIAGRNTSNIIKQAIDIYSRKYTVTREDTVLIIDTVDKNNVFIERSELPILFLQTLTEPYKKYKAYHNTTRSIKTEHISIASENGTTYHIYDQYNDFCNIVNTLVGLYTNLSEKTTVHGKFVIDSKKTPMLEFRAYVNKQYSKMFSEGYTITTENNDGVYCTGDLFNWSCVNKIFLTENCVTVWCDDIYGKFTPYHYTTHQFNLSDKIFQWYMKFNELNKKGDKKV